MMTRKLLSFLALALFLAAAGPLAAADIRFELGFGWTLVGPFMNASYVNQYQPTLTPPDRYVASAADQTVHFKAKATYGMNGFFNVLFTENVGLQILADYHRPGLGGSNAPYDIAMQFLAFNDLPETYARSIDWANSAGNLTETMFSLNALARFRVADNLSLSVSAGPSVFHFDGKAGHIGYTYFNLALVNNVYELTGGTYRMVVAFGPQTKYGMNLGIEAAYEAFRHVILALDLRWYGAARSALALHVVEDPIITVPIDQIEQTIGLGSLNVNPSCIRAGLAIRFVF
jgi:hypothetical protein